MYKEVVKHIHEIVIVGPRHQVHTAEEEFLYIMQELCVYSVHAKLLGFGGKDSMLKSNTVSM